MTLDQRSRSQGQPKTVKNGTTGILFTIADISKTVSIRVVKLGQYRVCIKTFSKYANEDDLETRSRSRRQHQMMKNKALSQNFTGRLS